MKTKSDIPGFTEHEERFLIYTRQVNMERDEKKPANIATLEEYTGWPSKYFSRAWQKVSPELVEKTSDGGLTRLELTNAGKSVADKLMEVNEAMSQ